MGATETLVLFYPTLFLLLGIIAGIGYKISKCHICLVGLFGYLLANTAFFFFVEGGLPGIERDAVGLGLEVFQGLSWSETAALLFTPSIYSLAYTCLLLMGYLYTGVAVAMSRKNVSSELKEEEHGGASNVDW
ncbi:hypothetical protein SAMN05421743_11225 [Thalassobacillus cyri]|uniref:Uncharacterized protein n=1 Tax=Thalassobacillus cyri TaxID=571932 RepID=A0A1H4FN33_9BACI|nr:hypothetical protein SAMN05421743_11225 [Thalassobacillus cyri]